jgi:hypothetical protein
VATKKLRGKGTINIDDQIIRWRQKLEKESIVLGKHTAKDKGRSKRQRAGQKKDALVAKGKFNFFGGDDE